MAFLLALVAVFTGTARAAPIISLYSNYTEPHSAHATTTTASTRATVLETPVVLVLVLVSLCLISFGLLWSWYERHRRRQREPNGRGHPRMENYRTRLCDCICNLHVCLPSCLFTPFVAAFNRAEADGRECGACDMCFNQWQQYSTRQTIRGRYGLQEDLTDALSACCCTPCAVGQDAMELEQRRLLIREHAEQQLDEEELALEAEEDSYFRASRSRRTALCSPAVHMMPSDPTCVADGSNTDKFMRYVAGSKQGTF